MKVRVLRQPALQRVDGRWKRTKNVLQEVECHATYIFGHGVDVIFPLAGVYTFNKSDGSGRGRMRDWWIPSGELRKLLNEGKKPDVVPQPTDG